ncbi:uncharacterized protein ACA1_289600 [Acanthamoeba castellanii str. Neff]|uniref:Uncharacterized protein n=1 Tax=Acanthamoeba castellanii (strain ATCC 30010 / Neff) TaxID=1257118 RepID=L8HJ14_ACACF|nr:uncharacterized protein ACA1_289600 [Acanthamoeba castellanii str. Neff]ELR25207.1 hypothetical protein ACA1_289600 [Acanthamoeba castellanii str. Neff]
MCDVCGRCYMFELVADDFRRIVRYEAPRIVLHGVRDITTLLEEDPGVYASQNGWECAREFPHLTTHEEILSATKGLNPWQQAGFVVRDALGNRIKYLSPQYMAFFFAMGWQNKGFGPLNLGGENFDFDCLVEVHRFGAEHTFLHFFPKWAELMAQAAGEYAELVARFDAYYAQVREVTEQRELAQRVKALALPNKAWPALIFEMKKEDVRTARTFFAFIPRSRFLKVWKSHRDLFRKPRT